MEYRIHKIYNEHKGMADSPMITDDLQRDERVGSVGRKRVTRVAKESDLYCKAGKKFKVTTDAKHNQSVAANILDRKFTVSAPNKVWISDLRYLKVGREAYYNRRRRHPSKEATNHKQILKTSVKYWLKLLKVDSMKLR
ncbi:MAG: IS3 family transposase [Desulfamplus sp.]|nr:IS3 family transposase [Desulfamplus sp.]